MFLLLSNDDGYLSPGIRILADLLRPHVTRLAVIAPDRNCSGASHSLTLNRPLAIYDHGDGVYSVDGTPSDCVHLAVTGFFDTAPEMVISGINCGANLGDDVMYSGTVAAAFEGRHLGLPAIAVSSVSDNPKHFYDAAQLVLDLFKHLLKSPLSPDILLNVNIPDISYQHIKGFRTTVLSKRHPSGPLHKAMSPRGKSLYWIGPAGEITDDDRSTDYNAISEGYVSVTPLQFDLTHHKKLDDVSAWLRTTA